VNVKNPPTVRRSRGWFTDNDLTLNIEKTREPTDQFQEETGVYTPLYINEERVEVDASQRLSHER